MKKNRKTLSLLLMTLLCLTASTGFCFAETVPAYMTISGTPAIDVDISYTDPETGESVSTGGILMTGSAAGPELEITSLKVSNNNAMGIIKVEELKVQTVSEAGWTVVDDNSDFSRLAADSKKFSLVTDSHDFSSGAYDTVREVNPKSSITYEFTGKTGPVSEAVTKVHIADAVLTLSLK